MGKNMFDIKTVFDVFLAILTVVPNTLGLGLAIMIFAIALGTVIALIRAYKVPILNQLAVLFISYMRGTPLLVHLFIIYYALPMLAVSFGNIFNVKPDPNNISPVVSIFIAYSLYTGAFQAESIKGALASVDFGQMEAAYSVGLTPFQAFSRIVFPQALIVAVPNFCNAYVGTIKALSLAFTVAVVDIMAKAQLCSALNFRYIESYLAALLVYWILCIVLTYVFRKFEVVLSKGRAVPMV
jgi:His/Glu/Gln/Arg/opine family amino acid ABC transporter permease subunit